MRIIKVLTFAAAVIALAAPSMRAAAAPVAGPSFSCAKPSEIEAVICGDPDLSSADRRMMSLYDAAKPGALGSGSNQLSVQRQWLKDRDKNCAKGAWRKLPSKSLRDCIAGAYNDRLEDLAVATLMNAPAQSLAELRRLNPAAAPIYEALSAYASIDDPGRRARTVEGLLAPLYAAMDPTVLGNLQEAGGLAKTAHEAAASDAGFARFFDVSAMFNDIRLTWPCAALVRRPGLVEGLGAFWGGAIDGAVPNSDCDAVMPAAPEVSALIRDISAATPYCDGTIRFSTGRDFAKLSDVVLLHRPEVWKASGGGSGDDSDAKAFRRKHSREIIGARQALSAYYAKYFGVSKVQAQNEAGSAIDALAQGTFGQC